LLFGKKQTHHKPSILPQMSKHLPLLSIYKAQCNQWTKCISSAM